MRAGRRLDGLINRCVNGSLPSLELLGRSVFWVSKRFQDTRREIGRPTIPKDLL